MHDIAMDSSGMNTVINQEEEERNKRIHLKFTAEKYLASFNNVQIRWFFLFTKMTGICYKIKRKIKGLKS